MPTSTSYKSAPTRIQVSNKKTPVFEEELPYHEFFIHWRSYRYTNRVWVEIFPSQTKKNIFVAIPCDLFGMVKRAPFKGESWPPTIGDNKKVTNWNHLDIIIPGSYLFPQRISPPKKTSTFRSLLYSDSHFDHWVPRSQTAKCFVRSQDLAASRKVPKLDPCDNQWTTSFRRISKLNMIAKYLTQIWESEHILKQDRNGIS